MSLGGIGKQVMEGQASDVTVRLIANHPRREPFQTVWTLWGEDEEIVTERLGALGAYRTTRHTNSEIVALMLRRADKLGTIEGSWTREAVDGLVKALPTKLADIRTELEALFAPTPRAARRHAE